MNTKTRRMSHMIEYFRQTLSGINIHTSTPLEVGLIALVNRRPSTYDLPDHASPMSRLPVELLLQIAERLSQVDRICLALTCKDFYALMKAKKLVQPIRFYNVLDATSCWCQICGFLRYHEFNVIQRLSNSRWKACPRCIKLHPFSKVTDSIHPWLSSAWYRKDVIGSTCYLGREQQGRVFLCRCIAITYHQKIEMIKQLKKRIQQSNSEAVIPWLPSSHARPWHTCTVKIGPMSKMIIQHFPYLGPHYNGKCQDELMIYTTYRWVPCAWNSDGSWNDSHDGYTYILACPHRDVLSHWEDWMLADQGRRRWRRGHIPDYNNMGHAGCVFCKTYYTRIVGRCTCNILSGWHHCKQKGVLKVLQFLGPDHVPQPGGINNWSCRARGNVLVRPSEDGEYIHDEDCPKWNIIGELNLPWMPYYSWTIG